MVTHLYENVFYLALSLLILWAEGELKETEMKGKSVNRFVLMILLKLRQFLFFFSKEELKDGYQQKPQQGLDESQVNLEPHDTLNTADSIH